MPLRRTVRDVPESEVVIEEHAGFSHPWSPAQIVAVLLGIGFLILGVAGLARTGLPVDHLMRPQKDVIGFLHSPLLGSIEIVFGALLIVAGVTAGGARSVMAFLGVIATTFGVLVLLDVAPSRLHRWLGVGEPYGWLALAAGLVLLIAAFASPEFGRVTRTREARRDRIST